MGTLLSGPSVVTLAEAAAEQLTGGSEASRVAAAWAPLVTLQAGAADRQALFCMPVLGGDAASYRDLADAAPDDLPVVAIRPRGLEAREAPHTRLDEMARDYAEAIRRHQPDGPYHLVGWSTGGLVALAVAEQLREAQAEVGVVAMLDTPPTGRLPRRRYERRRPLPDIDLRVRREVLRRHTRRVVFVRILDLSR